MAAGLVGSLMVCGWVVGRRADDRSCAAASDEAAAVLSRDVAAVAMGHGWGDVSANTRSPEAWWREHPRAVNVASAGALLTFRAKSVARDGEALTWVGSAAEAPGAIFVGVARRGAYHAVLLVPGEAQRSYHFEGGTVWTESVPASGRDCDLGVDALRIASAPEATALTSPPSVPPGSSAAIAEARNVDVLFLYNTRALAIATARSSDPVGYIDSYTRAALATANEVLANSRIDAFRWRYVGLVAVPEYPQKETVTEDLLMIAPDGPLAGLVATERLRYGADQVLLWTGTGPRQGSAYGGAVRNQPVERGGMVAALRLTAGVLILAHELAHNFGCHHDRGHAGSGDGSAAQPEGDGNWCYGLLWNENGGTTGTVMAYADVLVPYFSNPNIQVGGRAIGYAESEPRAAFNARILTDFADYLASETPETEAPPMILQQPADMTVATGTSISLTVSAVGGGLRYQWMKNGVAIEGETASELHRSATAGEVGRYSVTVSNSRGAVTSRSALLMIAVAGATGAPSPANGGGGGGGATSGVFPWLVAFLAGARVVGRSGWWRRFGARSFGANRASAR